MTNCRPQRKSSFVLRWRRCVIRAGLFVYSVSLLPFFSFIYHRAPCAVLPISLSLRDMRNWRDCCPLRESPAHTLNNLPPAWSGQPVNLTMAHMIPCIGMIPPPFFCIFCIQGACGWSLLSAYLLSHFNHRLSNLPFLKLDFNLLLYLPSIFPASQPARDFIFQMLSQTWVEGWEKTNVECCAISFPPFICWATLPPRIIDFSSEGIAPISLFLMISKWSHMFWFANYCGILIYNDQSGAASPHFGGVTKVFDASHQSMRLIMSWYAL